MKSLQSTFIRSLDDGETFREHLCVWNYYPQTTGEPEEFALLSIDGLGKDICSKTLWQAAEESGDHSFDDLDWS